MLTKDQITLLKSLAILRNKIDFYLIFMGRGILKKKLEKYSKLNNLQNKVKFINFKKNPYPYIKQADLFILTSKYEGLPNVLLEAITLKKFIISSNCPTGPREILLDGKGGSLFAIGDAKNLARKIMFYYKNKKKCNRQINISYKNLNSSTIYQFTKYHDLVISTMKLSK